ncbi:hypothetical protein [Deinococcus sp. QL22]|uniref:hypothetical protein n=1 Tax=Deinococcus sp. QL22 TaxID=2939437 RepID=UPI002017A0AB|nr:hypothetical protein [Deinococcus sp. QL22]UQN06860.1 hypothetical protein M1R55_02750 [Deinococcus sp. QL22]
MIKFRRQNALTPEKDAEVNINLVPLLFFVVGYVAVRALLHTVQTVTPDQDAAE